MDLNNNVKTVFRADTSQAVAATKHLRGVEREEAKKTLASLEQHNAALDKQLALFTKIGAGIGAAYGIWRLAGAGVEAHLEDLRLEAAAAGANVERLADATRGLIEEDNLLAFAGRAMNGVWKLNQAEMETVLRGTDVLAKRMGIDLKDALDIVTESVTKGSTRALKELGLEVKNEEEFMRAFASASKDAGQIGNSAADEWRQATVTWNNAVDDLKGAFGELVIEMTPLLKAFAAMAGQIADIIAQMNKVPGFSPGKTTKRILTLGMSDVYDWASDNGNEGGEWGSGGREWGQASTGINDAEGALMQTAGGLLGDVLGGVNRGLWEMRRRMQKKSGGQFVANAVEVDGHTVDGVWESQIGGTGLGGPGAIDSAHVDLPTAGMRRLGGLEDQAAAAKFKQDMQDISNIAIGINENMAGKPTILEQIFGKPDDITALSVAVGVAADAVNGLTNAIAASFEAAVTGSDSAVAAFKKVAAGAVHAIGKELAVIGAQQAVKALVDLATGNLPGAALHAAAASAAFAGSGVAFKVAQEMGYGASASSASRSSAGSSALGGGSGTRTGSGGAGGGQNTTIIYVGADYYDMTTNERQARLARAVHKADQSRSSNIIDHR